VSLPDNIGEIPIAKGHLFLLSTPSVCSKCKEDTTAYCLASTGYYDEDREFVRGFVTFSNLRLVSKNLYKFLVNHAPGYKPDYSKAAQERYFINHCSGCGAKKGDYYLHGEPGMGTFLPMSEEEARSITLEEVPFRSGEIFDADYGIASPSYIPFNARRIGEGTLEDKTYNEPPSRDERVGLKVFIAGLVTLSICALYLYARGN